MGYLVTMLIALDPRGIDLAYPTELERRSDRSAAASAYLLHDARTDGEAIDFFSFQGPSAAPSGLDDGRGV